MGRFLETTVLILGWSVLLSLVWGAIMVVAAPRRVRRGPHAMVSREAVVPSVALGLLVLVLAHQLLGWNLLFPVHLFATLPELVLAAIAPALVLFVASGMEGMIRRLTLIEWRYWQSRFFTRVARSLGRNEASLLRRVVFARVMVDVWSRCLPWLFGELIVVECVFNAPGLGLDAWHRARERDMIGLREDLLMLGVIYLAMVALSGTLSRWLGRRLATYV